MSISRFSPEDLEEAVALGQNLESGWSLASVRREVDRPSGLQLIAYGDCTGPAIGWCCRFQVGEEAELLRIGVVRSERMRGVASVLLAHFEKECARLGVSSVFLEVAEANPVAQRLYAKFSYKQVGRRKGYYVKDIIVNQWMMLWC